VSFVYDAKCLIWLMELSRPPSGCLISRVLNSFLESLILAQDERWRRA
jgi:hypothetical protein